MVDIKNLNCDDYIKFTIETYITYIYIYNIYYSIIKFWTYLVKLPYLPCYNNLFVVYLAYNS